MMTFNTLAHFHTTVIRLDRFLIAFAVASFFFFLYGTYLQKYIVLDSISIALFRSVVSQNDQLSWTIGKCISSSDDWQLIVPLCFPMQIHVINQRIYALLP